MTDLLTINDAIELTGKSKSTILRFIRKYKKNNPNQKEIILVKKNKTREYKITSDLINKYFLINKNQQKSTKIQSTDHTTSQTTSQKLTSSQLDELYKLILEEKEKRILELKKINERLIEENNELRTFNKQLSGYFASLSQKLQLPAGEKRAKNEVLKKTINTSEKEKKPLKTQNKGHILKVKGAVKGRVEAKKKKGFLKWLFGF
jgi:FMN-dependent NADH-azoreductase